MLLPIRTDSPLRSTPWMNWLLIGLNVIIFLAQQQWAEIRLAGMLYPTDLKISSYFTYAFLHAGVLHLVGNMLFLYIFGNNVCDKLGNFGYLGFYLAGGVFAGIGYVVTLDEPIPMLGASGAVAAVTGAYLVLFPRSTVTVLYFFILIGVFHLPSMWLIAFFFLKDVVMNFAGESNVAHTAHIGGTVFGVAVCMSLLAVKLLPRDQYDVLALLGRWHKRRQYQSMVRQGYDPFGHSPARIDPSRPEAPPDPMQVRIQDLRAEISESIAHHKLPKAAQLYRELHSIDAEQVLSRQAQLDVANQLASEQHYPQAADAYEQFLKFYGGDAQGPHVELMLGLIYGRYLMQYERAKDLLVRAAERLSGQREGELARQELIRIEPMVPSREVSG
jgi:membrane associated rhomboid family serine protease